MKVADITSHATPTIIAAAGMVLGLLLAIVYEQKELAYLIAGALAGAIRLKPGRTNYDKG